ncbi:MAG: glycoside hydrolase family 57 protein [Capnocytophaga leadbetteri]|jgi:glycosyl hydrolase, family 57|uniref:glycoside hydrolase family 57 protein n=1 Tax=Capnocytophaga leadbetteri TaxID=327575 RepID=UPI00183029E0|nr:MULTISPECIES: glycoside hydrolase family 57 protein [Capnocytophaga]MBB1546656.1 polysaccharide deacetylase family protein [Capnocytophaga sp.]MBB1568064.1 polysaccharide deacetylase family protein [Capnocytophaga sp.]
MKKSICIYFQIHHPERLRKYQFFDIGKKHNYFDNYANRSELEDLAENCYLPANALLLDLIKKYEGKFKVAFSISGSAIDQLEMHTPEVIRSFQELAQTGQVEFLAETYSHSLASLSEDTDEFELQVKRHSAAIKELFGKKPVTFRNTSLIYSDKIGKRVADLGFKTMLTDGAKHVLGWKSPNFVYKNALDENLNLLLKNSKLSDDIAIRFSDRNWSEYPLTSEKYVDWVSHSLQDTEVLNLFMNYEVIGHYNRAESGIFDFLRYFIQQIAENPNYQFLLPKEVTKKHTAKDILPVPYPISWTDEERDITSWLGNELQKEAFTELFKIQPLVKKKKNAELNEDYSRLQASEHFYFMRTKLFSGADYHKYILPYESPYEAFINYMNVLSDFIERVKG